MTHVSIEDLRAGDLSTEMLACLLADRRAREAAGPPPPLPWEGRPRTIEDRAFRFARWARSWAAEDDLIGCSLTTKLRELGYSNDSAAEVLQDIGVVWCRRTAQERMVDVASEMLSDGWDEAQVRWSIARLVNSGH